jgi:hypothetical protein
MTKIISNNRAFNLDTPTKAGTYSVLYRRAKSYEKNVGTAKFTKKNGWTSIIGKSGKALENTFNNVDSGTARATPVVIGWSE